MEQAEKSSDSGVAVVVEGHELSVGAGSPTGGWDGSRYRRGVKAGMWRLQVGWVVRGAALTFWWRPRRKICLSLSRAVVLSRTFPGFDRNPMTLISAWKSHGRAS